MFTRHRTPLHDSRFDAIAPDTAAHTTGQGTPPARRTGLLRRLALAAVVLAGATACTPTEIALYLRSTAPVADALSADQLYRLRMCESTDNYSAVNPSGTYRGAYQFDQRTWDDVAGRHFPWLIGRDPATVEPWWQDAMARALYSERGAQPWPVCGKRI